MKYSFPFSKKDYYGTDTPSSTRIAAINGFLVSVFLIFYGLWVDFVPSESWESVSIYLAAALSVATVIFQLYVSFISKSSESRNHGHSEAAIRLLVTPFISFLVFWLVLSDGFPALLTRIVGSDHSESAVLNYEYTGGRYCPHRLKGPPLDRSFPGCIRAPFNLRVDHPQHIKLSGKNTFMGFYIVNLTSDR